MWDLANSPIIISVVVMYLKSYPDNSAAITLKEGLTNGFRLQYSRPRISVFCKNLISAFEHPHVLQDKIDKEVLEGRMAGPFDYPPVHNLHVSPIGVVPKSDGGWRMITHLSYPPSISINNHIDPVHTSVNYTSFDTVIQTISHLDKGALRAKADIKSAFRLIRVHPADFELLGLNMNGKFYADKCLPFGCSISCKNI
jgi:hypothetical protein